MRNRFNIAALSLLIVGCFLVCHPVLANDSSYYMSGNHLIPLKETDISVSKEILTIELNDFGYVGVDVYYEFFNPGKEKTLIVGFEAEPPSMSFLFSRQGIHPFMSDFSVVMNGDQLRYRTGLVYHMRDKVGSEAFQTIDNLDKLLDAEHYPDDCPCTATNVLWDEDNQSPVPFSYAYYCDMTFKTGINIVKHHYKYKQSDGVGYAFYIPYLLTPALRWANHQIDDFTLRIIAPTTAKNFLIKSDAFIGSEFHVTEGAGKIRKSPKLNKYHEEGEYIEVSLREGAVEWHLENYKPQTELAIYSGEVIIWSLVDDYYKGAFLYDRSIPYAIDVRGLSARQKRVLRNAPYANRGYVFKNKELQDYFNSVWWYMPNPDWIASDEDFTAQEKALIEEIVHSESLSSE